MSRGTSPGRRRPGAGAGSPDPARRPEARQACSGRHLAAAAVIALWSCLPGGVLHLHRRRIERVRLCCWPGRSAFFVWLFLAGDWTPDERRRLVLIALLFLAAAVFWSCFEQAGSTLTCSPTQHPEQHARRFSFPVPRVAVGQPLVGHPRWPRCSPLWVKLGRREPSSPASSPWAVLRGGGVAVMVLPQPGGAGNRVVVPVVAGILLSRTPSGSSA